MIWGPPVLLVGAVAAVGVLHTMVPDHWAPIALIARQRGWSKAETARAALQAGIGHVGSTLLIALAVWLAGTVFAARFGQFVDVASSLALIGFGGWIAVAAWRELRSERTHSPDHAHGQQPPHAPANPHPHAHSHRHFHSRDEAVAALDGLAEHEREAPPAGDDRSGPEDDPLYAPLRGDVAVLTRHAHLHRHGRGGPHLHWHDHMPATAHPVPVGFATDPPLHRHRHKTTARTALLLILGSSPMVEGIPAFFAAARYGAGLISIMAVVFALSTVATYVVLCTYSAAGLGRLRFGPLERYGEVLSGVVIALIGAVFGLSLAL